MAEGSRLSVREMQPRDLAEVLEIERTAYSHPWTLGIFRDCLRTGYHCRVYEAEGRLVGYSVHSVAVGEAHLLNLCVRPECQGRGFGRAMLRRVMREAAARGADTLFLEVRVSNAAARALYESEGFNEVGRRFDYYPALEGREDAVVYARVLAPQAVEAAGHE